jgi:hypothetical protein
MAPTQLGRMQLLIMQVLWKKRRATMLLFRPAIPAGVASARRIPLRGRHRATTITPTRMIAAAEWEDYTRGRRGRGR